MTDSTGLVENNADSFPGRVRSRHKIRDPTIECCNAPSMAQGHREQMCICDLAVT